MNIIIWREWFGHKLYPVLFGLCIIVSLGAFLTLDALQQSVDDYVDDNQKQIVGGDIIITDNQKWPKQLLANIEQLDAQTIVFDYQFNAIAYNNESSLLTRIKAVSSAYPLYGKLNLTKAPSPLNKWIKGTVLVEQQVLNSLNVKIGDSIQIGEASFIIHDEIISEPDRPLTAFGFGARIIMHDTDLVKTNLMGQKSRINYRIEIKTNEANHINTLEQLKTFESSANILVKTANESSTSISNLSQNFLVFLKLLVVAVILLSGIGIMSIVKAFVSKQKNTNAIRAALGEPSKNIIESYRILFTSMAVVSVLLAWIASISVLYLGSDIFNSILPDNIDLTIGLTSIIKALIIAVSLTALMTHFTLDSIHRVKPVAVLHKHSIKKSKQKPSWLWLISTAIACVGLLYSELDNVKQSLQVLFGLIIIWFIFAIMSKALMKFIQWLLHKKIIKQWLVVLALQNIFRKGNQSNLFITALSLATMILGSITILNHSIQQQLIATYPEDAPNFFLLDVQVDQQDQLDELLGESLTYYPVIRARIDSVRGIKAEVIKAQLSRYDNISRMFNLSYSNILLKTEIIDESLMKGQLFTGVEQGYEPVSILNTFAGFLEVKLGDKVVFNVQGIKIKAQITSIRKRLKRGPSPFFYFLFPPEVMAEAPQIRFATAKVNDQKRINMQTIIAKKFPGITTLDGGSIAKKLKEFVDQLLALVQIFTGLSLFAGLLIFATSLISTSQDRLRESFYYRMMGMTNNDLLKLSSIEFLSLGFFAYILGVVIAVITSALITKNWFALDFIFPWQIFIVSISILFLILITISIIYTNYVKQSKVVEFLRHES